MEIGLVHKIDIDQEMQQAYLDYAMSVIVARALPDARDGLKPVHRRILFAMHDLGLRPESPYKKSARIVGEVLGKYHPHGDMSVYEAMARMAQDFSMRYPLVEGQGNFGSVDGDDPAAMRYTEARLEAISLHLLADIQKNTVQFADNFDSTLREPTVLPSAFPNLLVNGATGIAVGMATSIPPHNLSEVIDALHFMLQKWDSLDDISVDDLMHHVKGPDFPTGGIIIQDPESDGLISAYSTGRGRVTVRASAHLEEMERGRSRIIVSELPYMTNKSALIERIASLAREERLEGIADLRDESDRQGMRIVIELTKAAVPEDVLSELYKSTPMESTFSIIMLALVDGEPRLLSLKQSLRVYIEHRLEIVRRRSEYDLERARQRAHILEGLRIALNFLDEVISIIRKAPDADVARDRLIKRFKLSDIQAQAILDMPLRRLAALERKKIEDEYKELLALIKELEALLRSPKKMRQVVDEELQLIKENFGDRRRTHIVQLKAGSQKVSMLTSTALTPEKMVWISVTREGLVSRSLEDQMPRLSGKDAPAWLVQSTTRDILYLVSEQGEAAALPVHAVPEAALPSEGMPLAKISALKNNQTLAAIFTLPSKEKRVETGGSNGASGLEGFVLTTTRMGMVKKSATAELPGPSAGTFTLVRINEGDRLGWAQIVKSKDELLLITARGMAIRFPEHEVRPMGLVAAGVMGIKLAAGDEVAGAELLPQAGDVFMVASDGSAKRVPVSHFSQQGRYGQGLITWKLPEKVHVVGMTVGRGTRRAILHLSPLTPKSIRLDEAPLMTRTARGQNILEVKSGLYVTGLTIPCENPAAKQIEKPDDSPGKPSVKSVSRASQAGEKTQKASVQGKDIQARRSEVTSVSKKASPKSKAQQLVLIPTGDTKPTTSAKEKAIAPKTTRASSKTGQSRTVSSPKAPNKVVSTKPKKVEEKKASTTSSARKQSTRSTPAKVAQSTDKKDLNSPQTKSRRSSAITKSGPAQEKKSTRSPSGRAAVKPSSQAVRPTKNPTSPAKSNKAKTGTNPKPTSKTPSAPKKISPSNPKASGPKSS